MVILTRERRHYYSNNWMQVIRYDDPDTGKTTLTATIENKSYSLCSFWHGKDNIISKIWKQVILYDDPDTEKTTLTAIFENKLFFMVILTRERQYQQQQLKKSYSLWWSWHWKDNINSNNWKQVVLYDDPDTGKTTLTATIETNFFMVILTRERQH